MSRTVQNSHPGERILFKTRPRFFQTLESAHYQIDSIILAYSTSSVP